MWFNNVTCSGMIIENLSGITAGSPMVGTPIILVWRPINPGLIVDIWIRDVDMASQTNFWTPIYHCHVCKMEVPYTDQWYSIVISTQWLYTITYQCCVNSHCVFMLHALSTGSNIQVGLWAGEKWSGEGNGEVWGGESNIGSKHCKAERTVESIAVEAWWYCSSVAAINYYYYYYY